MGKLKKKYRPRPRKSFYWIVARIPNVTRSYQNSYIEQHKRDFLNWLRKSKRLPDDGFHIAIVYDDKTNSYVGFKMLVQPGHPYIGSVWLFDGDSIEKSNIKIL